MKKILLVLFICLFLVSCSDNQEGNNDIHNVLEHDYQQVEIIKVATCNDYGLRKLICSCGATIEEKTPMKEHSFVWQTEKEATCIDSGLKKGVCSVCNKEETKIEVALGHEYVWSVVEEATCTDYGLALGVCSCNDTISTEIEPTGHNFVDDTIVKVESTTQREGSLSNVCLNCSEEHLQKIMKTPTIVRDMAILSWEQVPGADGYNLYIDDEFYADLGNVLKFNIPLDKNETYSFKVEAYTNDEEYFNLSEKSSEVTVEVKHDTNNLQKGLGTDFERFNKSYYLTGVWTEKYVNFGGGQVMIVNEDDNGFAKLIPTDYSYDSTLTHEANLKILKAGTYVISMDVKLGSASDGTLSFGIYDDVSGVWEEKPVIDISNANDEVWTIVTYEYTVDTDLVGTYAHLEIEYDAVLPGNDNYILIDNIKICSKGSKTNLESKNNYDFENLFKRLLSTPDWKSDGYNNVIYVSDDDLENSLVTIDGNTVFKAYSSEGKCSSVNFKGNTSIATAGVYKLTVRVKGGPDADRLGSIGVRLFGENSFKVVDVRFDGVENVNSEEWTTLSLTFVVNKTKVTSFVNIEFYVFTHNDENPSPDNYLLMDDLSVYKIDIQ